MVVDAITLLWTIAPKTKGNNEAISKDVLISKAFTLSKYWVPGAKNRQWCYRCRYRKHKRTVLFWHPRNPITEAPNRSEQWIPLTRPQVVMEPQRPVWESAPTTYFQSQAFFSFIIIINIDHLSFHCCSLGNALVMIAVKTKSRLRTTKSSTDLTDIVQGGKGGGGYLPLITSTFFQAIMHHGKIKCQLH